MWFCLLVAIVSSRSVNAQIGGIAPSETISSTFEVDGFVFDGPADRPFSETQDSTTAATAATTSSVELTSSMSSTTAPPTDQRYDQCVTTCPVTPEYNPVCGSDNVEYDNPGRMSCASICGRDVTLKHYGRCMSTKIRGG